MNLCNHLQPPNFLTKGTTPVKKLLPQGGRKKKRLVGPIKTARCHIL